MTAEAQAQQGRKNKEDDDDRTLISKNISWILRRGARMAGVKQDPKSKWVKFTDLCEAKVLKDFEPDMIWDVIVDFNGKKLRYEILEDEEGRHLRAYKREKNKEKGLSVEAPEFTPTMTQSQQFPTSPTAVAAATQAQQAYAAAAQMGYPWNFGFPMMSPFMMMPHLWQQAQGATAGKYQGRIKSYKPEKGFGFIECQQTWSIYQRDVFLHKAQIGNLHVGNWVQFSAEMNNKGMPQAKDVQPLPMGQPPAPGQQAPAAGGKGSKGKSGGKDGEKGKAAGKGRGKGGGKKGEKGGKAGKDESAAKDEGAIADPPSEAVTGDSANAAAETPAAAVEAS